MSSRFCKSIPSEIYFTKGLNGWYDGPYVNPPKGKQQVIICKIMEIKVGNPKKKSKTLDSEKEGLGDQPSEKELKDSRDLKHLAEFLRSAEGKTIIRKAQEKAEEDSKIIDKMNDLSNIDLTKPFDI